jgi:methyl-accepting chemotaxis protein
MSKALVDRIDNFFFDIVAIEKKLNDTKSSFAPMIATQKESRDATKELVAVVDNYVEQAKDLKTDAEDVKKTLGAALRHTRYQIDRVENIHNRINYEVITTKFTEAIVNATEEASKNATAVAKQSSDITKSLGATNSHVESIEKIVKANLMDLADATAMNKIAYLLLGASAGILVGVVITLSTVKGGLIAF